MFKILNPKLLTKSDLVLNLGHLNFDIIWNLVLVIWNFLVQRTRPDTSNFVIPL